MWLTKRQFEKEKIERELNYMACDDYRRQFIDKNRYSGKTRMLAANIASERYLMNVKNIRETTPYKDLYFYAVDKDEGINYFDKVIEYRGYRLVHYSTNVCLDGFGFACWSFSFEFTWNNGERIRIGGYFYENLDLIKVMKLIDDYYENKFYRYEDFKSLLEKAGACIDE